MNHRVVRDGLAEHFILRFGRQFPIQQQVAGFQERCLLSQIVNGITAMQQNAGIAVDIRNLRGAVCRRGKAGIVCKASRIAVKLGNIDHIGTNGCRTNGHVAGLAVERKRCRLIGASRFGVFVVDVHDLELSSDLNWAPAAKGTMCIALQQPRSNAASTPLHLRDDGAPIIPSAAHLLGI